MSLIKAFWRDERGLILSAELVLLGTIGVIGATVGLSMSAMAVNEELQDFAFAIRSLDQSYSYDGYSNAHSWAAGSSYVQPDIATSLDELRAHRIEAEKTTDEMRELWKKKPQKPNDNEQRPPQADEV